MEIAFPFSSLFAVAVVYPLTAYLLVGRWSLAPPSRTRTLLLVTSATIFASLPMLLVPYDKHPVLRGVLTTVCSWWGTLKVGHESELFTGDVVVGTHTIGLDIETHADCRSPSPAAPSPHSDDDP